MILNYFKEKKDHTRFLHLHPMAALVMMDMLLWCEKNKLPFLVTSTVSTKEEDDKLSRVSSTHRECRAFDLSVRGWTDKDIGRFRIEFNKKYANEASKKADGSTNLVVYHIGTAPHLHIQLNKSFALEPKLKKES